MFAPNLFWNCVLYMGLGYMISDLFQHFMGWM